ncbi:phosphatidate cytidylyltransferase [Campylobacter corcagiensis]|uniref:Phosphatidate cytidylyltransferase n=1 Tax=Campylobacter corcagiensis TaxID=1448857 RepID=A0A7M1LH19_9BACT|nr:phosphatidate cytidylyltransferase [Campylobacter corcagiensis]QKF64061.1 CDP-diglyceride synthetase [Campylobacter corcagiensis]QOQ87740.1 phosphatidate cytidylyltransferase [Campylobacter corcagiensis]
MKTRIKTAGILIAALLVLAWLDFYILNLAIFVVALVIAMVEAFKLYGIKENDLAIVGGFLFVVAAILCGSFSGYYKFIIFTLLLATSIVVLKNSENLDPIKVTLYPFAPLLVMWAIYDSLGMIYLVYLIVIVAVMDSGAYFVGKFLGSHTFTTTSPNKTIEGVIGGFVATFFIAGVFYSLFLKDGVIGCPFLSTMFIALASFFGDLFESYLKRKAGVKDSGDIFPGHGGMLDRLDSYLFASIAMSMVVAW